MYTACSALSLCTECEFPCNMCLCSMNTLSDPALMSPRQIPIHLQHIDFWLWLHYRVQGVFAGSVLLPVNLDCVGARLSKTVAIWTPFCLKHQVNAVFFWNEQCPNLSDKCRMSQTGVCVWVCMCVCLRACGGTLQCHWETKHWECSTGMTSSVWDGVCLVCLRIGML